MNKVKGNGLLRHYFHGTYSAGIVLAFNSPEAANDALDVLGGIWKLHNEEPRALTWFGDSDALKSVKKQLASFGADEDKIDSIKYSIDVGEKFSVEIPVVAKEQLSLL